jgi:hypothetical protein
MEKKNLLPQANASVISITTTKEKRNLVFMNNFYHKVAVASVGIALGFALGIHKEAKAATFTFTETSSYHLRNQGELPDWDYTGKSLAVGIKNPRDSEDYRAFYEFNIPNLSLDSNTIISSATLLTSISNIRWYRPHSQLKVYGYTESEKVDTLEVYNIGEYLDQIPIDFFLDRLPETNLIASSGQLSVPSLKREPHESNIKRVAAFNVLPFINNRIGSNNSFAGFGLRFSNEEGFINLNPHASLTITTAKVAKPVIKRPRPVASERVPEPTTILGSAIGLCLGGWLKRKKSTFPNKTTSQG